MQDRLLTTTNSDNKTITYAYDANGNVTKMTDPDHVDTVYTYDAENRLLSVTTPAGTTRYTYDADDRLKQTAFPNNTVADYTYDADGRTTDILNQTLSGQLISSFHYTYDANGNRLQQVEKHSALNGLFVGGLTETTNYTYDGLDRLASVQYGSGGADGAMTYTYDAVGNRLTAVGTDPSDPARSVDLTYTYDEANELVHVTDNIDKTKNVTYDYDRDGSRIDDKVGDPAHPAEYAFFTYDDRSELVQSHVYDGSETTDTSYDYDFAGERIEQATTGADDKVLYDGNQVLLEYDGSSGDTLFKYVDGVGAISLVDMTGASPTTVYYLVDALGSVSETTGAGGSVVTAYSYDAWGEVRASYGDSGNQVGFTGQFASAVPGLDYFNARYYDFATGTFLTRDSFSGSIDDPGSLNHYVYAKDNPLKYVDPTGHEGELASVPQFRLNEIPDPVPLPARARNGQRQAQRR